MSILKLIFSLIALSLLSGCQSFELEHSSMKTVVQKKNVKKVAIIPFENLTPNVKAGEDMAKFTYNQFFTHLYKNYLGKIGPYSFKMIDEPLLDEIMHKNKWLDQTVHLDVGLDTLMKELGCDILVLGTVSEYHYKRGLGEDPVVGLHLRLYDGETKTVIWSGSHSSVGRFSWFVEDALSRLGQQVSSYLTKRCFNELHTQTSYAGKH